MPRPKCARCGSEDLSNVTVEIGGGDYRLCGKCFDDYLKVNALDDTKQEEFIRGKPPNSLLGKLWYWIRRGARAIIQE